MKQLAGVDYSSKTIYLARVSENGVEGVTTIDIGGPEKVMAYLMLKAMLVSYREVYDIEDIWIEQPWVNGQFFPKSGLMMARSATWVETASYGTGLRPHFIEPRAWRKVIFGNGGIKDPKEAAVKYVKEKFDYKLPNMAVRSYKPDHNIAEAICIGQAGLILQERE